MYVSFDKVFFLRDIIILEFSTQNFRE